ncbi:MAG: hypothetical protein IJ231_01095 [Clostridia bacterium]|nr:hypothetical protein [Clostridia bacterium]MBQ9289546.1 hypothetical protein [Clostridia bacterium]
MKKYWILTRIMLRNMLFSLNPFGQTFEDEKKRSRAVTRALLRLVLVLLALGSIVFLEYEIYRGLGHIGMPMLLPALAIFASTAFSLFMGLYQGLSELYQGKDAPFLAVLPLTSRQVFAARLTTLYLSELGLDAVLCLPAFVLYALGTGSAMPTALTALPTLLLLPMLPLSLVALVSSLLMRVSFFARNRDGIIMGLTTVLAIGYSIGVTLMNSSSQDPSQAVMSLLTQKGILEKMGGFYPPAFWATRGFTGQVAMLLLFAAVSLAAVAAVITLVGPGYLNQALTSSEKTVVRKKNRGAIAWRKRSAFAALHALEWREILRTPAWAYNSLMGVIMFPLMICIGTVAGVSNADELGLAGMRQMLSMVDQGYVALVTAGVLMFGSMVNPAVSTAISREGSCWPFALTLPVRQKSRFLAKMLVGLEINLVCSLLIGGVAWFLTRMNPLWLLAALGISFLVGLASAAISLWVDARHPRLSWASEMEAIKKNFNQVYGMLLWVVLVALCVIPAVLLWSRGGGIALLGVAGAALAEAVVSMILLLRISEKHTVLQS